MIFCIQATEEVRTLEAFYKMMKNEQARAFYGPKHVFAACEAEAIEVLLISDKLFRAVTVAERKKESLLLHKKKLINYFTGLIILQF